MNPLPGYAACKKITVKTTYLDAAQTNFIFVYKPTADTNIGGRCLATGYDIRFTMSDGVTPLNYERVSFSIAAGAATGIFWIQSDLATSPATDVYIHYGNASATDVSNPASTWSAAYTRVWHLSEAYGTGAGNYKDALGVGNLTLTDADGDSAQGTGIVGKCVDLNGDADMLTDADHADHDPGGAMTAECFVKIETLKANAPYFKHGLTYKWTFGLGSSSGYKNLVSIVQASGTTLIYGTNIISSGVWYHVVFTFDRTKASNRLVLYLNGAVDQQTGAFDEDIVATVDGILIGKGVSAQYEGLIDEVRYSKDAKSASWIKFVYRNITEADNCLTVGPEELSTSIPVFVNYYRQMRGA